MKKELAAGSCRIDDLLAEPPELARGAKVYDLLLAEARAIPRLQALAPLPDQQGENAWWFERQRAELIASLRR